MTFDREVLDVVKIWTYTGTYTAHAYFIYTVCIWDCLSIKSNFYWVILLKAHRNLLLPIQMSLTLYLIIAVH